MNTFLKISLGFVIGVVCTIGVSYIIISIQNTEDQIREERRMKALNNINQYLDEKGKDEVDYANVQSFELNTKKGIVKLHTYMPKDSVKILMGRPQSNNINAYRHDKVYETWFYKGTNQYDDELRIDFVNGKLNSVLQY